MKTYNEGNNRLNRTTATLSIATIYFVISWLQLQLAAPVGYMPAIFPSAGIAVSAFFVLGRRAALGLFIGSFSINLWLTYSSDGVLLSSEFIAAVLIALANVAQGCAGGWTLRRVLGYPCSFDKTREILFFLLLTPLFCLIDASVTLPTLFLLGLFNHIHGLQSWLIFWLGDTIGVLLMLPLVLTLIGEPHAIWRRRRTVVAIPLLVAAPVFIFAFFQAVRWEQMESLNYLRTQIGWQSWTVLLFGLIGTALLDAFLLLSSGHAARVEMEVEQKVLELRESTEKLRALFELSPLGIVLADMQGRYIDLNEAFAEITGYTIEELKQIDYSLLVPPHHRANSQAQYAKAQQLGRYGPYEKEYLRKDGTLIPVSINGMLITGQDGEKYFWSIVEDISERKCAEHALRESEERWQFALEGAGDGIWDIDLIKREMFFSPQAMAMLGYECQARHMTTDEWKKFVHPEDLERGQEILDKCIESKKGIYVFDFRALTKDGQWRWLRRRGKLIGSLPDGLPARMIGTHTDIHYERQQNHKDHLRSMVMEMIAGGDGLTTVAQIIADTLHGEDRSIFYSIFSEQRKHLTMIATNQFLSELGALKFSFDAQSKSGGNALRDGKIIRKPIHDTALWQNLSKFAADAGIALCWIELITGKEKEIRGALVAFNSNPSGTTLPDIDQLKHGADLLGSAMQHNELEEQVKLIASVYEASSEGIMITDGEGHILAVNPAFTAITGYSANEVMGQPNDILHKAKMEQGPYPQAQKSINKTGQWKGDIFGRRKNGEAFSIGITINTVWDADGNAARRVCVFSDITEKVQSEQKMQYLATHDTLTELPNRLLFQDRFQQALANAQRENTQFALLYIDLDHFKPVNDTLGHNMGDQLLKSVAVRMQTCVRDADTVARIGGDEFVVLLPTIKSHTETLNVAEKIKRKLNESFEINGSCINISASVGVAIFPDDGESEDELSQHADIAMYYAKREGRNKVGVYRATNSGTYPD